MIILVFGGRDYAGDIDLAMSSFHEKIPVSLLIHGGARGADLRAKLWANSRGIHDARVDALWDFYGKPAGYRRNSAMSLLLPGYGIAFPGGKGTADMVKILSSKNIPIWKPYP